MSDNFKAKVGKLTPFSHFLHGQDKWVVTPDQPDPEFVQATSVNLAGMPQKGFFPPDHEVDVIKLASGISVKKKTPFDY